MAEAVQMGKLRLRERSYPVFSAPLGRQPCQPRWVLGKGSLLKTGATLNSSKGLCAWEKCTSIVCQAELSHPDKGFLTPEFTSCGRNKGFSDQKVPGVSLLSVSPPDDPGASEFPPDPFVGLLPWDSFPWVCARLFPRPFPEPSRCPPPQSSASALTRPLVAFVCPAPSSPFEAAVRLSFQRLWRCLWSL